MNRLTITRKLLKENFSMMRFHLREREYANVWFDVKHGIISAVERGMEKPPRPMVTFKKESARESFQRIIARRIAKRTFQNVVNSMSAHIHLAVSVLVTLTLLSFAVQLFGFWITLFVCILIGALAES